jgi:phosphate transport system permease protein
MMPAIINTVLMTALSLLIAAPFGIFAAVYLVEYAKRAANSWRRARDGGNSRGHPLHCVRAVRHAVLRNAAAMGLSLLAGACTLAVMILPLILRTTEEALKAVPDMYREGSFGLARGGSGPYFPRAAPAVPGILAGVILGIGRIVGETAALIYTAGTVARVPENLLSSTPRFRCTCIPWRAKDSISTRHTRPPWCC